jgi:hypothetical protein
MNANDFEKLLSAAAKGINIMEEVDKDLSLLTRVSKTGYTLLAVSLNHPKQFDNLLAKGAHINLFFNKIYYSSRNLLMLVSQTGQINSIKFLLERGANVNICNNHNWNALSEAVTHGRIDACRILLNNGANPNYIYNSGKTLVMLAAKYGFIDIIMLLIDFGAKIDSVDSYGLNAFMYASMYSNIEVFRFFLLKGLNPLTKDKNNKTIIDMYGEDGNINSYKYLKIKEDMLILKPDFNWVRRRNFMNFLIGSGFQHLFAKKLEIKAAYEYILNSEFGAMTFIISAKTPEQKLYQLLKKVFSNNDISRLIASYI